MGLKVDMESSHAELIAVANEQEKEAIAQVAERFSVMRSGIDVAFDVERAEPADSADQSSPKAVNEVVMGATS